MRLSTDLYEINNLVASAFARYPYPESFFTWGAESDASELTFFNRSDRRPPWMGAMTRNASVPRRHRTRTPLSADCCSNGCRTTRAGSGACLRFTSLVQGVPYQVVAQLNYTDNYREQLADVVAFTINLDWVREHYFRDLTHQVWNVSGSGEEGLVFSVVDAKGAQVVGSPIREGDALTNTRPFELMFFDPDLMIDPLARSSAGAVESSGQRRRGRCAVAGDPRRKPGPSSSAQRRPLLWRSVSCWPRVQSARVPSSRRCDRIRLDRDPRAQDAYRNNPRGCRDVVAKPPERDRHISIVRPPCRRRGEASVAPGREPARVRANHRHRSGYAFEPSRSGSSSMTFSRSSRRSSTRPGSTCKSISRQTSGRFAATGWRCACCSTTSLTMRFGIPKRSGASTDRGKHQVDRDDSRQRFGHRHTA